MLSRVRSEHDLGNPMRQRRIRFVRPANLTSTSHNFRLLEHGHHFDEYGLGDWQKVVALPLQ